MRKMITVFAAAVFLLAVFPASAYGNVLDEIDNSSAYGQAIGGAMYALYEGPQSISYNPAGVAIGTGGVFFSHIEHFLGVVRNEYLSSTTSFGNFYFGGALQSTYPTDTLNYIQYHLAGNAAYRFGKNAVGANINTWIGSDIKGGFSMDFGGIVNLGDFDLGLVLKNAFASITWNATPSATVESYPAEFIVGAHYSNHVYNADSYLNLTAGEFGIGAEIPITNFFYAMGGYRLTYADRISNEITTGVRMIYSGFDLTISYTFKDALWAGDSLSPFYMSLTYNFGGN